MSRACTLKGRSKSAMRNLFGDAGANLSNDAFDVVWDKAHRREGVDDKVSVEVFRQTLREHLSPAEKNETSEKIL